MNMNNKLKIETLRGCFEDVIWMAIRYAHGSSTYAPGMVRDAVNRFQTVFPDWKPKSDTTIEPPLPEEIGGLNLRKDYLDDLFKTE